MKIIRQCEVYLMEEAITDKIIMDTLKPEIKEEDEEDNTINDDENEQLSMFQAEEPEEVKEEVIETKPHLTLAAAKPAPPIEPPEIRELQDKHEAPTLFFNELESVTENEYREFGSEVPSENPSPFQQILKKLKHKEKQHFLSIFGNQDEWIQYSLKCYDLKIVGITNKEG